MPNKRTIAIDLSDKEADLLDRYAESQHMSPDAAATQLASLGLAVNFKITRRPDAQVIPFVKRKLA